jgi:hypothetical protein
MGEVAVTFGISVCKGLYFSIKVVLEANQESKIVGCAVTHCVVLGVSSLGQLYMSY